MTETRMLGVYVEKELAQELKRLACRRDITMTSIVKDVLHREINAALVSGELNPRETPNVGVMGV